MELTGNVGLPVPIANHQGNRTGALRENGLGGNGGQEA